ncbi:YciI family protein [Agromyces archimandritae]|uniref:YciI family protein n=1 Tax=Agromyces archimandritae TaxID=2781962 RepID=A0A975IN59_9MICO|nr:YciI family protein [Agromyces archimandritae]QTX03904.1 YciI family protein [Agromyces archimandritae]
MSKYMLIMRADDTGAANYEQIPFEQVIEAMGRYNEAMMNAGVLLAGEGLSDASEGFVVDFSGEEPLVTDGPFGETRELFNGFWIIEASTREEAAEWAKRAPLGPGAFLEVRRVNGPEDFPQDNEWIKKEEGWREEQAARAAGDD